MRVPRFKEALDGAEDDLLVDEVLALQSQKRLDNFEDIIVLLSSYRLCLTSVSLYFQRQEVKLAPSS